MADKAINQLPEATQVDNADLFVLEQTGVAKKLTGQTLIGDLATALSGHGGISNIAYTPPVAPSLNGTLTITLADNTSYSLTITNGNGIASVAIKYGISSSGTNPASVTSWSNSPVAPTDLNPYGWTRIAITDTTANTTYAYAVTVKADDPTVTLGTVTANPGATAAATITNVGTAHDLILDFGFTLPKGDTGDTGDYIEPVVSYGTSTAAATEPSTWYSSPTSISYSAGNYIWKKTQYTLHDAQTVQATVTEIIGYIGQNGSGSGTVNQITFNNTVYTDDGTGNVSMTVDAADVGAIAEPSTASNGQVLTYDSNAGEWVAANPSTGNVNTVNNVGVDAGTTNITLYANAIKMSSSDSTTINNAIPSASSTTPANLGTAAVGTGTTWARADHVHKMPSASDVGATPSGQGIPSGGTAGQVLTKDSSTNYDASWANIPSASWESEALTTNLTIYRQGNMRTLMANGVTVANPAYTLAAGDKPAVTYSFFGLSGTTSSNRAACFFRIYDTGGVTWRTFSGGNITSGEGWGTGFWSVS